jgi:D-apiose dehydrogenase
VSIRATSSQSSPLRVAVVGTGYFSQFHMMGWADMAQVQVVAVCDRDADKAQQMAQRFGVANWYNDTERMLQTEQIDLLDIITPSATHQSLVQAAIAQGIPVICQKPFGENYAQAVTMTAAAQQAGVPLVVHENFRFMPWYREMRHQITQGLIGKVHNITFRLRPGDGQGAQAYLNRQPYFQTMPRFLIQETGIHFIDTFRYLVGEITAVTARLRKLNPAIAGEDAALVMFEFDNGAAGLLDANRLNDHATDNLRRTMGEMWVEGELGMMQLDGMGALSFRPHLGADTPLPYAIGQENSFGNGACGQLQAHVVAHLLHGTPIENTAQNYLQNLRIQEAVYASHLSGRRIEMSSFIPPNVPKFPFTLTPTPIKEIV